MSANVSNYGVQDIKTLEGIEAIRLRRRSDMMAWCIANQYELPGRLHLYAKYYPNVSFNQALKLYELAVEETIVIFNAKHLFDTPLSYGRGLVYAKDKWLQKMQQAEETAAARLLAE